MKAVIYCRVSTKEQTQNLSLPTQPKACREYSRGRAGRWFGNLQTRANQQKRQTDPSSRNYLSSAVPENVKFNSSSSTTSPDFHEAPTIFRSSRRCCCVSASRYDR